MAVSYLVQDTLKITVNIRDYNGNPVDPDTISLKIYDYAGNLIDTITPTGSKGTYTCYWIISSDIKYSQDLTAVLDYTYAGNSFRDKTTFRVAPAVG